MSELIRERFLWVEDLRRGLVFLLGDTIDPYFQIKAGSDPLAAYLTITLKRPIPKASRDPLRSYIRFWAEGADCAVPRIDIEKHMILAVVLFKYRHPRGQIRDESVQDDGMSKLDSDRGPG